MFGAIHVWPLALIFILAGLYVGTEEALEDSLAAELIPKEQHGMAFGTLAAINAGRRFFVQPVWWDFFGRRYPCRRLLPFPRRSHF